jgi:hypothetical protein
MFPYHTLRKRNCLKIAEAFHWPKVSRNYVFADPQIWFHWIDPLSPQNYQKPQPVKGHQTFYFRDTAVHVPMDWFWREIEQWEIDGLVTEWKLQLSLKQDKTSRLFRS